MSSAENVLTAFVCGIDFFLSQATGGHCLTFSRPVEWSIEDKKVAGELACFKDQKSLFVRSIINGFILCSPVLLSLTPASMNDWRGNV